MPDFFKERVRKLIGQRRRQNIRRWVKLIDQFGLARYCPCCKSFLKKFLPFAAHGTPRNEAKCPRCHSLERHRLSWLYMKQKTDLFDGKPKKLLHVAPEPQLSQLFRSADYIDYLSADLMDSNAMVKMDVTAIQYPDESFDVIYCSHVLEHVHNDRKAMREFHRVLKRGGWAILQVPFPETTLSISVPITSDTTFEDSGITRPEERERFYGQYDHMRRYGTDYKDQLAEAGFTVTVDGFVRELSEKLAKRYGLMRSEDIYFCRKALKSEVDS